MEIYIYMYIPTYIHHHRRVTYSDELFTTSQIRRVKEVASK